VIFAAVTKSKAQQRVRAFCRQCRHEQVFVRAEISHFVHLLATVCTCGLWSISWISATIGQKLRPWRCKHCGFAKPEFQKDNAPVGTRKPF
jgi:hypothetical protein